MSKTRSLNSQRIILHIASGDVWAGAEIQLFYLSLALHEMSEIDLYVILFNKGVLYEKLSESGVKVVLYDENRLTSGNIFLNILKFIYKNNISVIHAHKLKEHILGGFASLFFKNVKYIRTIHGGGEHDSDFSIRSKILGLVSYLIENIVAVRLIYVSSELQSRLVKRSGEKHVVVENGLDFYDAEKRSAQQKPGYLDENIKKIVMIGRLVTVKRVDVFLEIAAKFTNDQNIRFYIIGDGPLKTEIKTRIKDMNIGNIVSMLGFHENPLPILKQMDYMMITSDHEGLPMSLLEALYLKVLVISHDIGGISEVLKKGDCGILIDSQEPLEYSESLKSIMSDRKRYGEIVNRGFDRVTGFYSSEQNASRYCEIYKAIT